MVENPQDPYDSLTGTHLSVIKGWQFCATLQLRTPLAVLEHHGDRVSIGQPKPQYGPDWAGCWSPYTKSLAEILGRPERAPTRPEPELVASPIGLVDSAKMVAFLKCYRTIIESPASTTAKTALVRQLAADPRFADMAAAFGHDVVDSFAADALRETFGISARIARALIDAGLLDAAAVRAATAEELRAIPGVGKKTIQLLRPGSCSPGEPS